MDLLSRYRNVTVLLLVIFAQLILLAYQVKSNQDVRLVRVWAVTAVTPLANVIESVRSGTVSALEKYILLHNLREENLRIKEDAGKLKLENQYLRSELDTADRVKALSTFQAHNPSRTLSARVIGTATGTSSRVVFIDRGSYDGAMRGMAVITPDGIVGKIVAVYPTASQVLLITDPTFAAGVISQKHRVLGTVHGLGQGGNCQVDYIQNEEQVDAGERFFTSGDDGVFPKGLPVGTVSVTHDGNPYKQVSLVPSGFQGGLEAVLIVIEGVHQPLPDLPAVASGIHFQPPPAGQTATTPPASGQTPVINTEADRLRERYQQIGAAEGHVYGTGLPGSKPPDFNLTPEQIAAKKTAAAASQTPQPPAAPNPQPTTPLPKATPAP